MRRWFWAALLGGASLTAVAVWLWTATPEACLAARFRGTIFQLLRGDAANTPEAWQGLMQEMSAFGIEELFLQWTSIDSLDFYYGHAGAGETIPLLPEIVRAAESSHRRLWIGLQQDTDFWSVLKRPTPELEAYFQKRVSDLQARLPALKAVLEEASPGLIAGWYLPEEIDDLNWHDPEREAVLGRYLANTHSLLNQAIPGLPVAVSVFSSGAQQGEAFGMQLRRLVLQSGIDRVLIQDGIGAGKRTPAEAALTARAVARSLRRSGAQSGMIIELFNMRQKTAIDAAATEPASIAQILERLAATAGIGTLPPTSFSHVHHLTAFGGPEAAERGAEWRQLLAGCR